MAFIGGAASALSFLLALGLALGVPRIRSLEVSRPRFSLGRLLPPIFLLPPISFGGGLIVQWIFQSNWFAGLVAFAISSTAVVAFLSWISAFWCRDWFHASIYEHEVQYRATKTKPARTETVEYIGNMEVDDFVSNAAAILSIAVIAIFLALLSDPWLRGLVSVASNPKDQGVGAFFVVLFSALVGVPGSVLLFVFLTSFSSFILTAGLRISDSNVG